VHFGPVNLVQFAQSFGAHGLRVNSAEELIPTIKKAFEIKGPVIVEVPIDYSDNLELFQSMTNAGH
jgi:acetolactate synthase-1/2/3 large subunit